MYYLLGISLTFAFLLIVNVLFALFATLVWKLISRHLDNISAATRAQLIFGLRILPLVASLVFVLVFTIPAYVLHEPEATGEVVSGKLALLAGVSILGICIALFRVFRNWLVTRRLASNWMENAVQMKLDNISVPLYRIKHQFPVIAVIGVFRPRMFVAEKVLESLDQNEFRAAVDHEYGHLRAHDNLRRTLVRACRDLLIFPMGGALDRAWAQNAESAADEYAAKNGRPAAVDLASALVKIARIVPQNAVPAMPAGAYFIQKTNADIASRVRHLLRFCENQNGLTGSRLLGFSPSSWIWSLGLLAVLSLPLTNDNFHWSTHQVVEHFVHLIQ